MESQVEQVGTKHQPPPHTKENEKYGNEVETLRPFFW